MPLPNDERVLKLAEDLLAQLISMAGSHPGFRPAHAQGILLKGTFTPTAAARAISKAPHFESESTPVSVRFSNSTGMPVIADTDPRSNPKGMALRFHLAERVHTDIISHSANGFPVRTGEEFLEMLRAIAGKPEEIGAFLGAHPEALRFVQLPNPFPASFATQAYFGVTALVFENSDGTKRYGRFQIMPVAGVRHLDDVTGLADDYLLDELKTRLAAAPIGFKILVQLAESGDMVDDASFPWPDTREKVELGTVELIELVEDSAAEQKHLIFDPIPRVAGIEPSGDPLLELRAAIYLISGRMRRAA